MRRLWLYLRLAVLAACLISLAYGCQSDGPISRDRCLAQPGFVYIPAGAFIAGSDRAERDYAYQISAEASADGPEAIAEAEANLRQRRWFEFEPERQTLTLSALCIAQQPVTNRDYQAFVQATGHRSPRISAADYQVQGFLVHPYAEVEPYLWAAQQFPAGEADHPVVLVSYADAIAYAQWRGTQDGQSYRLPTAEEWEKAARGADGQYFPWGNQWQADATNWAQQGEYHTSPVNAYPLSRSPYSVDDMAGNVFEYTSTLEPGRDSQSEVVMKGCSWDDLPGFCRGAYRHKRPQSSRHILFGFRLVLQ
ncbi:MAG: SUMF1/EgtB/PvdO family nonheme iron enzyme [Cyanobacteria bacterium P01_C01_bin.73]